MPILPGVRFVYEKVHGNHLHISHQSSGHHRETCEACPGRPGNWACVVAYIRVELGIKLKITHAIFEFELRLCEISPAAVGETTRAMELLSVFHIGLLVPLSLPLSGRTFFKDMLA